MKKLFILGLLSISLISCSTRYESNGTVSSGEATFTIIKVDGCEYLFKGYDRGCMFAHKGNCSNPIHYTQPKNSTNNGEVTF